MAQMSKGRCKACNAEVWWVKTTSGKNMPLDIATRDDGNIEVRNGVGHVIPKKDLDVGPMRHVSHFQTCPRAGEFRRKR